jgi:hypothetical protein
MMREQDRNLLEQQYKGGCFFPPNDVVKLDRLTSLLANEETLRAELQEARFRAESAETRLQFEQLQSAMGPMPAGTYGPAPYQYAPIFGPRVPEPYYAAAMNGGNQYGENQMPYGAREDFQYQRSYQPDRYQRPPDEGY